MNQPFNYSYEWRDFEGSVSVAKQQNEDEKIIEGYFTTFNEPYLLFKTEKGELWERIPASAFDDVDMGDVVLQYNHEGRVFARTSNGTLTLFKDDHGYGFRANLAGTEIGRQLYEEVAGGFSTKMSFSFRVRYDGYKDEILPNGIIKTTRTIYTIAEVYDISVVSIPANNNTEVSARNENSTVEETFSEHLKELEHKTEEERARVELKLKTL